MRFLLAATAWSAALFLFPHLAAGQLSQRSSQAITINEFVEKRLAKLPSQNSVPLKLNDICEVDSDPIADRVFREYGAVFVASEEVSIPDSCVFPSEAAVEKFQARLETEVINVGGTRIELQKDAARALKAAVEEAQLLGKRITALDGAIAGKRTYSDTLRIWNSRFFRALDHWAAKGKITRVEANYAASLPIKEQIKRVMVWEAVGYYFSTNFSISIFNSVAPPGTSQHLSLLAFDVVESSDPMVRQIMNKHGWFQTIRSDQPHFTYLGIAESELPRRGLTSLKSGTRTYWVPNVKTN